MTTVADMVRISRGTIHSRPIEGGWPRINIVFHEAGIELPHPNDTCAIMLEMTRTECAEMCESGQLPKRLVEMMHDTAEEVVP